MLKNIFGNIGILTLSVLMAALLDSCATEDLPRSDTEPVPLEVNVRLSGKHSPSRADAAEEYNDRWCYRKFESGNVLGFYSSSGNYETGGGLGAFSNIPLMCVSNSAMRYQFREMDGSKISTQYLKADEVFLYFPYDENVNSGYGMALRRQARDEYEEDKDYGKTTERCVDLLTMSALDENSLQNSILDGTMSHTFAELIIMRGEGFDQLPDNVDHSIYVVMKKPYTNVRVNNAANPWKCTIELSYDASAEALLAKKNARYWETWEGDKYAETGSGAEPREAWCAVLPTTPQTPTEIDYIELYDNDGVLQRVSALSLMEKTRKLQSGWRYPVEIVMNELVPTIYPYTITKWDGDIDLTDERVRGIHSAQEFSEWMVVYNTYLNGNLTEEALAPYGDKVIVSDTESYWQFYILDNLNLSGVTVNNGYIIPQLQDVIDARGDFFVDGATKLGNFRLTNLPAALVGNMSGHGGLHNIDIGSTTIISRLNSPAGILVNNMEAGTIDNVNIINGALVSNGPVGLVAGSMSGGTVTDCNLSGLISGSASMDINGYLTGQGGAATNWFKNNNVNVVFSPNN